MPYRHLYFSLRLDCVFILHFAFTYSYPVLFLLKCHCKELEKSSCSSNILLQRSSCTFIMPPQRSSCGFQDPRSSDLQSAARRTSSCGCKKKFLHMYYFWAVLHVHGWFLFCFLSLFNSCVTKYLPRGPPGSWLSLFQYKIAAKLQKCFDSPQSSVKSLLIILAQIPLCTVVNTEITCSNAH